MPEQARGTATKHRILGASSDLFMRQGYTGTGVKQIVESASAPFASLYHFFPGGKEELCERVIRHSGGIYAQLVMAILDPAPDLVTGVRTAFREAANTLESTDYADACPIATIALEVASTSEVLRIATNDVFESWLSALQERCEDAGIAPRRARELAIVFLTSLEGAFILSRAARTGEAVLVAGEHVARMLEAELSSPKKKTPPRRAGRRR